MELVSGQIESMKEQCQQILITHQQYGNMGPQVLEMGYNYLQMITRIHDMEVMEGWVITDANTFIQSFKQLTYIQDRKKNLENRNDSFYYFELLNQFEIKIGQLRLALLNSHNTLRTLYRDYGWIPVWKRIIQRINDIMEVSKITFPFEITNDLFLQQQTIRDVINFLGKKEDDGEVLPIDMMKNAHKKQNQCKSIYHIRDTDFDMESASDETIRKEEGEGNCGFFKQSHLKYLQSVDSMSGMYQQAMEIDVSETNNVYKFRHDKPLSVNLEMIYSQMLLRNQHIERAIKGYGKVNQGNSSLRKQEIENDIVSLQELRAKFLSEPQSVQNFQSERSLFENSIQKEIRRRHSNFANMIEASSFLVKKKLQNQKVSTSTNNQTIIRRSRDSQLLNHAISQIQRHKSLRIRKARDSTSSIRQAEFHPNSQIKSSPFSHKYPFQVSKNTQIRADAQSRSKLKRGITRLGESRRHMSHTNQNVDPRSHLNYGVVVRQSKNIHLITNPNIPSYGQYIKKHMPSQILRTSTCV